MTDKPQTTEHMPLVERLRKASQCVYLACEEQVARDLSDMLMRAADEIEQGNMEKLQ